MKERLVLLGPPAAGKGTQAAMIEARYGIPVTSPGAMLREEKRVGTALGVEAEQLTSRGKLLPDEIVTELVKSCLSQRNGRFVFDGFPRSIGQADALEEMLAKRGTPLDLVLALEANVETLEKRVAGRLMCSRCRRIFSVGLHVSRSVDPCPKCGGSLVRRLDDTPQVLAERMRQYDEKTAPLFGYYAERGLLRRVDSSQSPATVFALITTILDS